MFISLIFRYEILNAKYVDLLDKLKDVKKSPFSTVLIWSWVIFVDLLVLLQLLSRVEIESIINFQNKTSQIVELPN
jgi:hypothetical protein